MSRNAGETDNSTSYELKLESTEASAGYFMCIPTGIDEIDDIVSHLEKSPFDDFMRRYALRVLAQMSEETLIGLADSENPMLRSLLYETAMTQSFLPNLKKKLESTDHLEASSLGPLVYLKSFALEDRDLHNQWVSHFSKNLESHSPFEKMACECHNQ